MPILNQPTKEKTGYLTPIGFTVESTTNCSITQVIDGTLNELMFDIDATGDLTATIQIPFQIPQDFLKFAGGDDDLEIVFIQDADSGDGVGDVALTVDVLDDGGNDADDDDVDDIAGTGSQVTLDCAITAGTFVEGDYILVKITVQAKSGDTAESGDGARVSVPKIKYTKK